MAESKEDREMALGRTAYQIGRKQKAINQLSLELKALQQEATRIAEQLEILDGK